MAVTQSYYASDTSYLNSVYSLNISLEQHFSNMLFKSEADRIIWASNDYAFYQRLQNTNKNGSNLLEMPFMNYKLKSVSYPPVPRWSAPGYTTGVVIDEVQKAVQINPVFLEYESTFFCSRQDELLYAIQAVRYDEDIKTMVDYYMDIKDENQNPVTCRFTGKLDYPGTVYEPEYQEKDWLEKNNIHSLAMDFTVDTFFVQINTDAVIPLSVIAQFNQLHETASQNVDEATAVVDYFSQTVAF